MHGCLESLCLVLLDASLVVLGSRQWGGYVVQMHNQAKSSVTSSLEKVQAGKDKKEQELAATHHALEEANKKLQVCPPSHAVSPLILPLFPHFPPLHVSTVLEG